MICTNIFFLQVTMESIQNIRTVVQLSKEEHFYQRYCSLIGIPHRYSRRYLPLLLCIDDFADYR